ncbi:MAG: DUF6273 domain-containing protein, partial [Actinobacteria bacterium]|nr:DUF6273 domain-containing protein [Actinomycetota bacterium]
ASDSYVKFGQFGDQDVLWRVLRRDDGTNGVWLLSDVILESRIYDDGAPWTVWADSDIRDYLNSTFYDNLGTDKIYIKTVTVSTVDGDTDDKIFLPSIDDMRDSPFNWAEDNDEKRVASYNSSATDYWTLTNIKSWEPVSYNERYVSFDGDLFGGTNVSYTSNPPTIGVRPMLYLIPGLWFSGSGSSSDPYIITNPSSAAEKVIVEEPLWVRTMPMTCWQVWVNEDNNFQFIFWYPYKDNNWVQIFDMEGNMVYEVDIPLDDPNLIVDLPDGMYNVKTFRFDPEDPIQEFLIGKP